MDYDKIDEALIPFNEFVNGFSNIDGELNDNYDICRMHIENLIFELPLQIDIVVKGNGSVILGASPPLYYIETTIMPVFHHCKIKIIKEEPIINNYA